MWCMWINWAHENKQELPSISGEWHPRLNPGRYDRWTSCWTRAEHASRWLGKSGRNKDNIRKGFSWSVSENLASVICSNCENTCLCRLSCARNFITRIIFFFINILTFLLCLFCKLSANDLKRKAVVLRFPKEIGKLFILSMVFRLRDQTACQSQQ